MALELFDEWKFLAGLGIFLFGMFMMEESIKLLSGRSFKTLLRRYTGTRLKALVTGVLSTAVLQSSSAVSLMVLAFVGAGLLTLVNAIAVLLGSMIGTTVTAWIVAVLGFKFKIDAFALPLIGIGGLGLILFSRSSRYVNFTRLLAAFGFLFLGLDYMKSSVEGLAAAFDLSAFAGFGAWVFVIAGMLLTAVMQSSSAAIAVVLTTLYSDLIDFNQAAAMVIGANVGTTITVLLGSIGGVPAKKQAAFSSLAFNLATAVLVFPALPALTWIIQDGLGFAGNAVLGIAFFHTLFNAIGVLVFFPLIPRLAQLLERVFVEHDPDLTQYLRNTPVSVPEAAIAALRKEVLRQFRLSMEYVAGGYRLDSKPAAAATHTGGNGGSPAEAPAYADLEDLHADIFAYYARLQGHEIDPAGVTQLEQIIRSSRSIMNAARNLHELLPQVEEFAQDDNTFLVQAAGEFRDRLSSVWSAAKTAAGGEAEPPGQELLQQTFAAVETADRRFIRSCAKELAQGRLRESQVTRLLMANRFVTQAGRMLILSLQGLARQREPSESGG